MVDDRLLLSEVDVVIGVVNVSALVFGCAAHSDQVAMAVDSAALRILRIRIVAVQSAPHHLPVVQDLVAGRRLVGGVEGLDEGLRGRS